MLPPNPGAFDDSAQAVLPHGAARHEHGSGGNGNGNGHRDSGHSDAGALVPFAPDLPALPGGSWLQTGPQRPKALSAGPDVFGLINAARRKLPLALGVGSALGLLMVLAVWFLVPRDAEVKAYLLINRLDPKVFMDASGQRGIDVKEFDIFKQTIAASAQNPFVLTAALKKPGVASLGILRGEADQIKYLQETIKITPSDSEVMEIVFAAPDGEEAAQVLNAVVEALIDEHSGKRKSEKTKRLRDLEQQRTNIDRDLRKNASMLQSIRDDLGTANPEQAMQQHSMLMLMLRELITTERTLNAELLRREMEIQQFRNQLDNTTAPQVPEIMVDNVLSSDPEIQQLLRVKMETQNYVEELRTRLADARQDDPKIDQYLTKIENINDQIDARKAELRPAATQQVAMQMASTQGYSPEMLATQIRQLEEAKAMYEAQLKSVSEQRDEAKVQALKVNKVSGELERHQTENLSLTKHFEEIDHQMWMLRAELDAPQRVTLLQQATPPTSSDWKLRAAMVGFCGLLGFCAGLAGIALWEFQARRVSETSDISEGLGLRLVGSVPTLSIRNAKKLKKMAGGEGGLQSMVAESINSIRTTLLHGAGRQDTRVVMVTSATHGEAKTSLATQLAASIARAGRRTLLVDGDLRSPSAHIQYDMALEPGLCDVLRADLELSDVIRPTRANGLWMISAGQSDPEAVEALARSVVREAFEQLRNEFDFIIIDAGPVLPIADTLLLGQNVDTAILSVLRDQSQMPKVYEAYERLKAVGIPVLGAVVSGVATGAHERARPVPMVAAAAL